jgi:hypothetical protein
MKGEGSSKISVPLYQVTQRRIPKGHNLDDVPGYVQLPKFFTLTHLSCEQIFSSAVRLPILVHYFFPLICGTKYTTTQIFDPSTNIRVFRKLMRLNAKFRIFVKTS